MYLRDNSDFTANKSTKEIYLIDLSGNFLWEQKHTSYNLPFENNLIIFIKKLIFCWFDLFSDVNTNNIFK